MRIAIVGSGVIGLLTAVHCASAGHEVSVYEQGEIPSPAATSFDRHRVLRALHLRDQAATDAAVRAHHEWARLERLLSARFYDRVGALTVLPGGDPAAARRTLAHAGSRASVLGPGDLETRYPHLRFPAGAGAVFEFHAGVLLADRVLAAAAAYLRLHTRVRLHPRRRAIGVDVHRPALRLADGELVHADALLLAAGPWSRDLLTPEAAGALVLHRQSMLYCEVPAPLAAAWSATPAIASLGTREGAWLVPPVADTPLKLSAESACRVVSELGDNSTAPYWRDYLIEVCGALLPGFREDWLFGARDYYFLTRAVTDSAMVLSAGRTLWSFAACGGAAFKFAPLISRSLAERLTGAQPEPTGLQPVDTAVPVPPSAFGAARADSTRGVS